MNSENVERRSHYRRDFANPIEFIIEGTPEKGPFKGATINSSSRGLCFFTFNPVKANDKLRIVKSLLPVPVTEGMIRWVIRVDDRFYKVGFTSPEIAGRNKESRGRTE